MPHVQGLPCVRCQSTARYARGGACVECTRAYRQTEAYKSGKRKRRQTETPQQRDARLAEKRRYRQGMTEQQRAAKRANDRKRDARRYEAMRLANAPRIAKREDDRRATAALVRQQREGRKASRLTREEAAARIALSSRLKASRRRAAKRGSLGKATTAEIRQLHTWQMGRCAYCGHKGEMVGHGMHLDHKQPLSGGGSHALSNLQWLCGTCNMRKRTTPDHEYRIKHGIANRTLWDAPAVLMLI